MSRILTIACIAALVAAGALAQPASPPAAAPGNPATTPAGTLHTAPGTPAPDQLNDSDRLFIDALAAGGMAEVEAGKLASRVTGNAMVRQFGERMIQDHSQANKQLMDLATAAKVPLPGGPDTEHRTVQQQLEQLHGVAFDVVYARRQVQDHARTVQLLEYEIGSGQNPRLKDFASETLPVVLEHLAMAQRLDAELTGAGVPETAEDGGPGRQSAACFPKERSLGTALGDLPRLSPHFTSDGHILLVPSRQSLSGPSLQRGRRPFLPNGCWAAALPPIPGVAPYQAVSH